MKATASSSEMRPSERANVSRLSISIASNPSVRTRLDPTPHDLRERHPLFGGRDVEQDLVPVGVDHQLARVVAQQKIGVLVEPPVLLAGLRLKPIDVAEVVEPIGGRRVSIT